MKQAIFIAIFVIGFAFIAKFAIVKAQQVRQGQPQQQQQRIDPAKLTPGWHADTSVIQINYRSLRYDPKGHIVVKYFMTPGKKPINTTMTLVDSAFKIVKPEDVADIKN